MIKKKIIAIGGGEIGRPGCKIETKKIDEEIIRLSGKKRPRFLFIPTASGDSEGYIATVRKYFGKKLNCEIDVLYLAGKRMSKKEIEQKIYSADIVYVGGGNTLRMMNVWRKFGVDKILIQAHQKGIVMSGVSAGSVCWFKFANSDSRKFKNDNAKLIRVSGLGIINALHCPHYNTEADREESLKEMMRKTPGIAIALDNCAAIEIINDTYRIVASKNTANGYRVYWKKGGYFKEKISKAKEFRSLAELLKK